MTEAELKQLKDLYSEKIEAYLDAGHGECYLANPEIAEIVAHAFAHFNGERYQLHAWSIMPTHAHVVVETMSGWPLENICHSWLSFTANEANKALKRTGQFWQHEPYDHLIRSEEEYVKQIHYVWKNSEKAGLLDWQWRWVAKVAEPSWFGNTEPDSGRTILVRNNQEEPHQDAVPEPSWFGNKKSNIPDIIPNQDDSATAENSGFPNLGGSATAENSGIPNQDGSATVWTPAAGTFAAWPQHLRELKTLDPCCGSGHFLVSALLMLAPMRMALEGLSAREAVDAVLRENLHGLEIDRRCVELAAFALALTAWRFPDAGGYRPLPELQIACSGLSVSVAKEEWKGLALDKHNLRIALDWMYETFRDAPVLGSLLDPAKTSAAKIVQWDELAQTLQQALSQEQSDEQHEAGVVAQGLAKAATLLADKYHWVITNVPYLSRGKQSDILRDFCEEHYLAAKNDLATVFLDRCLELCFKNGTSCIVIPQNWLFFTGYKKFREKLLKNDTWHIIARLGAQSFQTPMWDYNVQLISISRGIIDAQTNDLFVNRRLQSWIHGIDVSDSHSVEDKVTSITKSIIYRVEKAKQMQNPDSRIAFTDFSNESWLSAIADYGKGSTTGDAPRFLLHFWEFPEIRKEHVPWLNSPDGISIWSGRNYVCKVPLNYAELTSQFGCRLHGQNVLRRLGVVVNKMQHLEPFLYRGEVFDDKICPICPKDESLIPVIWCYIESDDYRNNVRAVDQALKVTAATLTKVPFDLAYWKKVAAEKYPNGLPKPYSDDPTQWLFHGYPGVAEDVAEPSWFGNSEHDALDKFPNQDGSATFSKASSFGTPNQDASATLQATLQIGVARLLGYRWPAELDNAMELSDEARSWVKKSETLLPYADTEGIVCIPPVRGEMKAEDRLENLLAAVYGSAWTAGKKSDLLAVADHAGKSLESWLREKFFVQHCKLFQQRPFIWHIWDGLRDGFSALVNYHKLDRKNLETLIYTYLGDWINQQKLNVASNVAEPSWFGTPEHDALDKFPNQDDSATKLAAAENLQKRLELILEGEAPYDIFVRWKPLEQQPIGWNPDLNDGVRLNIRPFVTAQVLRFYKKPQLNISWDKDRGKDVESAPWYHLFGGDRINDYHLSLVEKRAGK